MQPTFRDLIAANKRNTVLLVLLFCLFVTVLALVLALAVTALISPDAFWALDWREAAAVGGGAALVSLLLSWAAYYLGADMVLAVSGARRIEHKDDPELFNVVEEMAIAAGVPMPAVYLMDDPAPNAFATGRDPQHAVVAVTTGLREKLTRDELQGVIAHEMSHVRNYDIRLMLLLAVLVGTVVMLCDLFWQILRFAPSGSSSLTDQRAEETMQKLMATIKADLNEAYFGPAPKAVQPVGPARSERPQAQPDANPGPK